MEALQQLMDDREGSPISDLLTEPPRLVRTADVAPSVGSTLAEPPIVSLADRIGNLMGKVSPMPASSAPPRPAPGASTPEPEYIPLTAEEIRMMAESKADMAAALLATFFSILNKFMAYQELRKGDKSMIAQFDAEIEQSGVMPEHYKNPDHPIHAARNRWENFELAMNESVEDAQLTEGQQLNLRRAWEAELKAKNKRGDLKDGTVTGTLLSIVAVKLSTPLGSLGTMIVNKQMERALK